MENKENFVFESPTRIYYGLHEEENVGKYISSYGFHSVLLVYGRSSCKKSGLYDVVINSLKKENIKILELSNVTSNPTLSKVNEGLALIRQNPVDLVLALGGGSVIDTAKSIANGYYYEGNPFDFNEHKARPSKALPIGVILTIAAAGSELSASCVITDESRHLKRGFNSDTSRPLFVIENPLLLNGLPKNQYAYGIVDILAHSMERYFSPSKEIEFSDYMALGLMKATLDASKILLYNLDDINARKVLILASSYSHNGLTSLMKNITMPVHQLEHELSGLYPNIAHGLGLGVLYPYWMEEVYQKDVDKFVTFGNVLFGIKEIGEDGARKTINAYKNFLKDWGLPSSLKEIGVKESDIETMAQSFATRVVSGILDLNYDLAKRIYVRAWKGA